MTGKFFILTFVCVCLAQVQGGELENAIKKGLYKARDLDSSAARRIDVASNEVDHNSKLIQSRTSEYIVKSVRQEEGIGETLRKTADALTEKAEEMDKPQSVFDCIKRVEEKANNQIETLSKKFSTDMERLEKVKLANIQTDSKPLQEKQGALSVRYQRTVQIIEKCKTPSCVDTAINSFSRWLNLMFADVRRIQGQVTTIYNNFERDARNYFSNANRQIASNKSIAMRNMRRCLYNREDIFQEN